MPEMHIVFGCAMPQFEQGRDIGLAWISADRIGGRAFDDGIAIGQAGNRERVQRVVPLRRLGKNAHRMDTNQSIGVVRGGDQVFLADRCEAMQCPKSVDTRRRRSSAERFAKRLDGVASNSIDEFIGGSHANAKDGMIERRDQLGDSRRAEIGRGARRGPIASSGVPREGHAQIRPLT